MINKKTVLVLGAGASVPYGFPTGQVLTNDLVRLFSKSSNLDNMEHALGGIANRPVNVSKFDAQAFSSKLKDNPQSIDKWLSINQSMKNIGRIGIFYKIMHYESSVNIDLERARSKNPGRWYSALWTEMTSSAKMKTIEDVLQNKLVVITWNYDRSLEEYLFRVACNTFVSDDHTRIANFINKIPIIHLHGSLGRLPWQEDNGENIVEFGSNASWREAIEYASKIKIIEEYEKNEKALLYLEDAQNVFFLGCGFHEENMSKLKINSFKDKELAATDYELAPKIVNKYKSESNIFGKPIKFYNTSIEDFISKHVEFE